MAKWRKEVAEYLRSQEEGQEDGSSNGDVLLELAGPTRGHREVQARRAVRRRRMRQILDGVRPDNQGLAHSSAWYRARYGKPVPEQEPEEAPEEPMNGKLKDPTVATMPFARGIGTRPSRKERAAAERKLREDSQTYGHNRVHHRRPEAFGGWRSLNGLRVVEDTSRPEVDRRSEIALRAVGAEVLEVTTPEPKPVVLAQYDARPFSTDAELPWFLYDPIHGDQPAELTTGQDREDRVMDADEAEELFGLVANGHDPMDEFFSSMPPGFYVETASKQSAGVLTRRLERTRLAAGLAALDAEISTTAFDIPLEAIR